MAPLYIISVVELIQKNSGQKYGNSETQIDSNEGWLREERRGKKKKHENIWLVNPTDTVVIIII